MDDKKVFVKNRKELEIQLQKKRICNQAIRMGFGIEKCSLMKRKMEKEN